MQVAARWRRLGGGGQQQPSGAMPPASPGNNHRTVSPPHPLYHHCPRPEHFPSLSTPCLPGVDRTALALHLCLSRHPASRLQTCQTCRSQGLGPGWECAGRGTLSVGPWSPGLQSKLDPQTGPVMPGPGGGTIPTWPQDHLSTVALGWCSPMHPSKPTPAGPSLGESLAPISRQHWLIQHPPTKLRAPPPPNLQAPGGCE